MKQNSDTQKYLGPLLTDPSQIRREAVRRRKLFDEKSVTANDIPDHEADGWQVDRKLKRVTRVKREKKVDERLENRFWMLLFKLGYPEISDGRTFTVLIERKGAVHPCANKLTYLARTMKQLSSPNVKHRRN